MFHPKRTGYVLFEHYTNEKHPRIPSGEFSRSKKELDRDYNNAWDDKWDYEYRHLIHYYYLDLKTMRFHSLPKWKRPYPGSSDIKDDRETVMSSRP